MSSSFSNDVRTTCLLCKSLALDQNVKKKLLLQISVFRCRNYLFSSPAPPLSMISASAPASISDPDPHNKKAAPIRMDSCGSGPLPRA